MTLSMHGTRKMIMVIFIRAERDNLAIYSPRSNMLNLVNIPVLKFRSN